MSNRFFVRFREAPKRTIRRLTAPPTAEGAFFAVTLAVGAGYLLCSTAAIILYDLRWLVAINIYWSILAVSAALLVIIHAEAATLRCLAAAAKRSPTAILLPLLPSVLPAAAFLATVTNKYDCPGPLWEVLVLLPLPAAAWSAPLILRGARRKAVLAATLWTLALVLLSAVLVWAAIDIINASYWQAVDWRGREIGDIIKLPARWRWGFRMLEAVGFDAALALGIAALAGAWYATGGMLAAAERIPVGKIFSRRVIALLVLLLLGYGTLLGLALRAEYRYKNCRAELETRFGRPADIRAWRQWVETGRRRDPGFWEAAKRYDGSGWTDRWYGLGRFALADAIPEPRLREWRETIGSQTEFRKLEALFDDEPPVFPRQVAPGEFIAIKGRDQYLAADDIVPAEMWRIRFALERRDREARHTAWRRMDNAIGYLLAEKIFSTHRDLLDGAMDFRDQAREYFIACGEATDAELRELAAQLDREDATAPELLEARLYLAALRLLDHEERCFRHRSYYPETLPTLRSDPMAVWVVLPAAWRFWRENVVGDLKVILATTMTARLGDPSPGMEFVRYDNLFRVKRRQAKTRTLRALIDVELEKRRTGKYPATLKASPDDPFTGQPMKYRVGQLRRTVRTPNEHSGVETGIREFYGVAVWSVGKNRRDDGGLDHFTGRDDSSDDIAAMIDLGAK